MIPSVFALIVLTIGLVLVYFGVKEIESSLGTLAPVPLSKEGSVTSTQ